MYLPQWVLELQEQVSYLDLQIAFLVALFTETATTLSSFNWQIKKQDQIWSEQANIWVFAPIDIQALMRTKRMRILVACRF
jgi:hypothetical protein